MKTTNESGRSMVEMLGVLAIIGVLSVGGIMGYTTAMRKYKANEIANTGTMLLMLAKSANGGTGDDALTLAEAGLTSPVANVDMSANATAGTVALTGTGIPAGDLCNAVKQMNVTGVISFTCGG